MTTLLSFINDGETNSGDKGRNGRVGLAEMTQRETVSEDETFERGVFFEQLGPVGSNVVDGSSSCERAG